MCFKVGKSAEIVAWLVRVWASADTTLYRTFGIYSDFGKNIYVILWI